ncbi:hypothetical protein DFQ26_002692 [Actinomortierella ambigua]|nr:hypothetical protein DFQ26_002692 [Actinomortierella ambigua]
MATPALYFNALAIALGSFQYGHHIGELNSPQKVITSCDPSVIDWQVEPVRAYGNGISDSAREKLLASAGPPSVTGGVPGGLPMCIPMTDSEWSVLVAFLTVGGLLGSLFIGGRMADRFGRRRAMMANNVFLLLGSIVMGQAGAYGPMVFGRFLIGIGCGNFTVIVPLYLAEISPPDLRGTLGIVVGILFSQVLGLYLSTSTGWRVILLAGAALSVLQLLMLPFCVESPRYMALQPGGLYMARRALQTLRGRSDVNGEIRDWTRQDDRAALAEEEGFVGPAGSRGGGGGEEATNTDPLLPRTPPSHAPSNGGGQTTVGGSRLEDDDEGLQDAGQPQPKVFDAINTPASVGVSVIEFVTWPRYRRPLGILTLVQLSQQLSGINGVMFYSTAIMSTILPTSGAMITVYISMVNVAMTLIAAYLMDRAGRRTLLLVSSSAMGVSSAVLAMSLNYELPMLSAVAIIAFVASFAIGLGPVPFLIIPEVVDTHAVGSASSYALSVNWTTNFIVSVLFLQLKNWLGGSVFFLFAFFLAGITYGTYHVVPETKGKTTDEVIRSWQNSDGF